MTPLAAMSDPALFAPAFEGASWSAWRAFLAALSGLPMAEEQLEVYRACTGRQEPPGGPSTEAALIVGRRGGKSRILALLGASLAVLRDYKPVLSRGEVATVAVLAADRKQARTIFRYTLGLLEGVPELQREIGKLTDETIELPRRRVVIEITTASFRATRGYTYAAVLADEVAFWRSEETSANVDAEILNALRPGLATIPGAMLLLASSPYAKRGALWDAYKRHFGKEDARSLVWKASSLTMNPRLDPLIIDEAYDEDAAAAAAEYGAEFRNDVAGFVTREVVDAAVVPGRHELPPLPGVRYAAFVDPSGGSSDSMTLGVAHQADGRAVLDAVREVRPPFSPEGVVADFCDLLKSYRVSTVRGDRYAREWPREQFRKLGVQYEISERVKSDLYRDLLPLLNSGKIELLDIKRLGTQLAGLERRTARGGRDSIDHSPGAHDDIANAVAGALLMAQTTRPRLVVSAECLARARSLPMSPFSRNRFAA